MNDDRDELSILAPREMKPKFDYLHREVQRAAGRRLSRREALGLGGMAIFAAATAAACGSTTTTTTGGTSTRPSGSANPLAGKPLENHLEIYNWSQYDDPSTFTKFTKLPAEARAGLTVHETFYSSNDELLAKLHAGGTGYDIKDFGITMFFYNHKIVAEQPKTMHDFYLALPKNVSKGRTNLLDGAEEV